MSSKTCNTILSAFLVLFVGACAVTNGFSGQPSPSHAWEATHLCTNGTCASR